MEQNNKREIDKLAESNYGWLIKSFVFVKSTKVKTWLGTLIMAFLAGIAIAIFWSISIDIKNSSTQANDLYQYAEKGVR